MKTRSNRYNNGYMNYDASVNDFTGIISINKYNNTRDSKIEPGAYIRPKEWSNLPVISEGEQKFSGVYAIFDNDENYVSFTFTTNSGTYTVDWGDGTTTTHTSGVAAQKLYNRTTYAALSSSVYSNNVTSYKTLVITVTPTTVGAQLLTLDLSVKTTLVNAIQYYTQNWLDIRMSAPNMTSATFSAPGQGTNTTRTTMLTQLEWIGQAALTNFTFSGCQSLVRVISFPSTRNVSAGNWSSKFHSCYRLQYVLPSMVETTNATSLNFLFYRCHDLRVVPALDTRNVTSMQQMFYYCRSLRTVPYMDTSKCTNLNGLFLDCNNLEEIPDLDTREATNLGSLFQGCISVKKWPKSLNTAKNTNFASMFTSCANMIVAPEMNTSNATNTSSMFAQCWNLRTLLGNCGASFYDLSKVTTTNGMFIYNWNLENIPQFITSTSLTNTNNMFRENQNLIEIKGFTTSAVTDANFMFNSCHSAKKIGTFNLSSNLSANWASTFSNLTSLTEIGLTGANQTFSIANCMLGPTALNNIFTGLQTVGSARTITVTGNWGTAAAGYCASIATAKGWTVTA